jgi:hypothetical protein
VTGLGKGRPGNSGLKFRQGSFFPLTLSLSRTPDLEATQTSIEWLPGILPAEVKHSGSEADRSPLSSVPGNNLSSSYIQFPSRRHCVVRS